MKRKEEELQRKEDEQNKKAQERRKLEEQKKLAEEAKKEREDMARREKAMKDPNEDSDKSTSNLLRASQEKQLMKERYRRSQRS